MPILTETGACQKCRSPLPLPESTCPNGNYNRALPSRVSVSSFVIRTAFSVLLFAGILIIASLVYLNSRLVKSEAYKTSLSTALSSTQVQNALGGDLHVKQPVIGYLSPFGDSQLAEWSVGLAGSRGRGHLYAVANQVAGVWDFSRLVFAPDDGGNKVDLTPVRPLQLPKTPTKNVYLLPLGLAEGESIQWAPAYYKSKLGIDLRLLPAIPLDPKFFDPARNQMNSDKCLQFLAEKYPELARDPSSILIVVTSSDMYIPDLG